MPASSTRSSSHISAGSRSDGGSRRIARLGPGVVRRRRRRASRRVADRPQEDPRREHQHEDGDRRAEQSVTQARVHGGQRTSWSPPLSGPSRAAPARSRRRRSPTGADSARSNHVVRGRSATCGPPSAAAPLRAGRRPRRDGGDGRREVDGRRRARPVLPAGRARAGRHLPTLRRERPGVDGPAAVRRRTHPARPEAHPGCAGGGHLRGRGDHRGGPGHPARARSGALHGAGAHTPLLRGRADARRCDARGRDAARHKRGYGAWTPEEFAAAARETPGGLHVDTTGWTVAETVRHVLDHLDDARIA